MGGTGTTTYPHHHRPIHHGLPTRTTAGTCGGEDIRITHAGDVSGGWCVGAGSTSSMRILGILDVDKVGAVIR